MTKDMINPDVQKHCIICRDNSSCVSKLLHQGVTLTASYKHFQDMKQRSLNGNIRDAIKEDGDLDLCTH